MPTLHVGFDEAGDFRFDAHGSQYYIFAAAYTYEPSSLANAMTNLRFSLLKQGHDLPSFHCNDDQPRNRQAVIGLMLADADWQFAAVVIEKRKVNPVLWHPEKFYPKFATGLLRFVLRGPGRRADRLVMVTDTLPTGRKHGVAKALHLACAAEHQRFWLYHHSRHSNKWIQVADYCAWGLQRKWERADLNVYNQLQPRLAAAELDVCRQGDHTLYY